MNIQAINNQASFKALYTPKNSKFSESQDRVLKDIKTKTEKDQDLFLFAEPDSKDSVKLSMLINPKRGGVGVDADRVEFHRRLKVGTYNEEHPFKPEDMVLAMKEDAKDILYFALFGLAVIAGILCVPIAQKCKPETNPTVKEQVVNPIKDSLQKVGKDTLDLTKQLLKK